MLETGGVFPRSVGARLGAVLVAGWLFAFSASAVTIDFEGSPVTGPFGPRDWVSTAISGECSTGSGDRARILDDEYASLGVALSPVFPFLIGGGLQPDGTLDPNNNSVLLSVSALGECPASEGGLAPLTVTFSLAQMTASFDVFMDVNTIGESFPVDLLDSSGNSFSTITLTQADAVIPTGPSAPGGRFEVSSAVPFFGLRIGLTSSPSGTGGFLFDNLTYSNVPTPPTCLTTPRSYCQPPSGKSRLSLKDQSPDSKDNFRWNWSGGGVTSKADFGSPTTTTDYALCLYDATGLRLAGTAPAAGTCASKPCWKESQAGFKYVNKESTPDGTAAVSLKTSRAGNAKISFKGKGDNLQMPGLLSLTTPIVVQLVPSGDTVCWGATYPSAIKSDAGQFKAKEP